MVLACLLSAISAFGGVSPGVVEWEFPRNRSCHEGLAFSDGVTGVLAWGGGSELRLTLGRTDLWDHRGGFPWKDGQSYSNIVRLARRRDDKALRDLFSNVAPPGWKGRFCPTLLPLGRVVIRLPGRELKRGELDTRTGIGKLVCADGTGVTLAMSKRHHAFGLQFAPGVPFEVRSVPATELTAWDALKSRGLEKAAVWDRPAGDGGGFDWNLPADLPVWVSWTSGGNEVSIRTGRGARAPTSSAAFAELCRSSVDYWREFWEQGARVQVPDEALQRVFDYGMYRFGAMTDPDGVPAGLQGPWIEDVRLPPWCGDYHFNINVQECYSPAFRGGHLANLLPLFKMVLSWRPTLRENARKFVGITDGYVLPHAVDDRGMCLGGIWTGAIDHASTAWVAAMMMRYVRYSRDKAFLSDGVYDFMKGAMKAFRAMMEDRGSLSLPVGPSPEWGGSDVDKAVGRNPSFQLAAVHRLARDLLEAAAILGERPDPMWRDVESRLPDCSVGRRGIELFEGCALTESHRHHSHLAGLYPFDTLDLTRLRADGVLAKTYNAWVEAGTGQWSGWCVPWAAILNVHFGQAHAAAGLLRAWEWYFCNPGHGSHHDAYHSGFSSWVDDKDTMQMDGQCAAAAAVMEMMVHEVNGTTEFFRGCPSEWRDVSFENVALADGRRIDGRRKDGRVSVVERKASQAAQ